MTSLQVFTLDDRVALQKLLYLPIEAIEEYGELYSALCELEARDTRVGTDIAQRVKDAIAELEVIEQEIAALQSKKNYGAIEIKTEVKEDWEKGVRYSGKTTIDTGRKKRQQFLIRQIKRDLNLQKMSGNRIPLG